MEHHGRELVGDALAPGARFPLLCKILDARQKLSLQVHPPAGVAETLRGEPKTEMWYIAEAAAGAELFVGLRPGVTRAQFEAKIAAGDVADCFHRIPVKAGDTMFLPSGRVHAIGEGLVIFEIQQNSDTTYRVFDWNRPGLDGKPRELHVAESLASIDFSDVEPSLQDAPAIPSGSLDVRPLVRHPLFDADLLHATQPARHAPRRGSAHVVAVVAGHASASGGGHAVPLGAGQFCVIPAALHDATLALDAGTSALLVRAGSRALRA
jgi:mannose-6-phosphate isomerase